MKRRKFLKSVGLTALGLLLRKLPRYELQPAIGVGSALGCSYGLGSFGLTVEGVGRGSWRIFDNLGLTVEDQEPPDFTAISAAALAPCTQTPTAGAPIHIDCRCHVEAYG